jgi:hypothetical protein
MEPVITIFRGFEMVDAPYDDNFISSIKNIGGKWESTERVWLTVKKLEQVKDLVKNIYGDFSVVDYEHDFFKNYEVAHLFEFLEIEEVLQGFGRESLQNCSSPQEKLSFLMDLGSVAMGEKRSEDNNEAAIKKNL